jgi:hypothetical protein
VIRHLLAAGLAAAASVTAVAIPRQEPVAERPSYSQDVLPLLERYCSFCHEGPEAEADLDLVRFASEGEAATATEQWQRVHLQVGGGLMPPDDAKRHPNEHERATLLRWIESVCDPRTATGTAIPHAPVLRRLNRFEYRNSIRDLLDLEFPAEEFFPADGVALGFDHLGSALTTSEALVEKFVAAAERIADQAINVEDARAPEMRRFGADELRGGNAADGSAALYSEGALSVQLALPRAGEYRVRAQVWGQQAGPTACSASIALGGTRSAEIEVAALRDAPQVIEFSAHAAGGPARASISFLNDYYHPQDSDPAQRDRNFFVDWVEVAGPLDPPPIGSFQAALFLRFAPELGSRRERAMIGWIARRAWRRPPTRDEIARLDDLSPSSERLEVALRTTLTAVIASPHFLFRVEANPSRGGDGDAPVRDLNAHELAARMSYFLWSSLPDEELGQTADDGTLLRPEVRDLQARRMLANARAQALATSFAAQWLQVRNLERAAPDPDLFPAFTPSLREAMRDETLRFFEYVLREDRNVWELLDADYTFLNEELAAHYGIADVQGSQLRRVPLGNAPRRGILGHASVLTVTSTPVRSAPVKRGKFILENLLGRPLPPPPPGVDSLPEDEAATREASLRERLARHRADPACGVCHAVMDPLGFALENYDPIGRWRESANGHPVDPAGALPDGRSFSGPVELVRELRANEAFLRCLTDKLLIYALGRAPQIGDAAAAEAILGTLDPDHPTLSAIVLGIIDSPLFRQRTLQRR